VQVLVPTHVCVLGGLCCCRGGEEVQRLCSTAERRELAEVLNRIVRGEPAAACSAAVADVRCL
jgi:hypothetical protein